MMNLFKIYRPVWQFLLVFFGTYGVFSGLYFYYLDYWSLHGQEVDPITNIVGQQVQWTLQFLGFNGRVTPWAATEDLVISIMNQPVARLVEGCNAVSVMILFVAFVIGIPQKISRSLWFILFGCIALYGINILRIVLISIGIYARPSWTAILHDLVFPGIIYGTVLLLWIIWIWQYKSKVNSDE